MTNPVLAQIAAAAAGGHRGDRAAARQLLADLWAEIDDDALHRCALAHALADVQDDPAEELAWDLRALRAADSISDGRLAQAEVATTVRGFYPSLHLNLADVYRRLGDSTAAREHLETGRAALAGLEESGYRAMIVDGFDRLAARLASTS